MARTRKEDLGIGLIGILIFVLLLLLLCYMGVLCPKPTCPTGKELKEIEGQLMCCDIEQPDKCCPITAPFFCEDVCPALGIGCPSDCCDEYCVCHNPEDCPTPPCHWVPCPPGYSDCNNNSVYDCVTGPGKPGELKQVNMSCYQGECTEPISGTTCPFGYSDCDNDTTTGSLEGGPACECHTADGEYTCCGGKCVWTPECENPDTCNPSADVNCCPGFGCLIPEGAEIGKCEECDKFTCTDCAGCPVGCDCNPESGKCESCSNPEPCNVDNPCCCGYECEEGVCEYTPPCKPVGGSCEKPEDCCSDYCVAGKCECLDYGAECTINESCCGYPGTSACLLMAGKKQCCNPNCPNVPECQTQCCDENCKPICVQPTVCDITCTAEKDCIGEWCCEGKCDSTLETCKCVNIGGSCDLTRGDAECCPISNPGIKCLDRDGGRCCYPCEDVAQCEGVCCDENCNPTCAFSCIETACEVPCAADGTCPVGSECCQNDDQCKICIGGLCGGIGPRKCPGGDPDCEGSICSNGRCNGCPLGTHWDPVRGCCVTDADPTECIDCPYNGYSDCDNNDVPECYLIGGDKECYQGNCQAGGTNCPAGYSDCNADGKCECYTADGSNVCCGGICKVIECPSGVTCTTETNCEDGCCPIGSVGINEIQNCCVDETDTCINVCSGDPDRTCPTPGVAGCGEDYCCPVGTKWHEEQTCCADTADKCIGPPGPCGECGVRLEENCTLDRDLTTSGTCIVFGKGGIYLDCAGHSISATAGATSTRAVQASRKSDIEVRNCNINTRDGILLWDVSDSRITGNTIKLVEPGGIMGIYVYRGSGTEISKNNIVGGRYGIFTIYSSNKISGNTISGVTYSFRSYSSNDEITGNKITDSKDKHMMLSGGDNILRENELRDSGSDGLFIYRNPKLTSFRNNIICGSGGNDIYCSQGTPNLVETEGNIFDTVGGACTAEELGRARGCEEACIEEAQACTIGGRACCPGLICRSDTGVCAPCIEPGASCTANIDCCSGICLLPEGICCGGEWTCCVQTGKPCTLDRECCAYPDGYCDTEENVCVAPAP